MSPQVHPPSTTLGVDVAVSISRGAVGAHIGLVYLSAREGVRHLHLAFHQRMLDEAWDGADGWIAPTMNDPLGTLRTQAALVAERHRDGLIPYAFIPADAGFSLAGQLGLGQSIGLTCATFVMRLCSSVKIELLKELEWDTDRSPQRIQADTDAQRVLVAYLQERDPEHAGLVEKQVGCARFRAEEVAAASGVMGEPHGFENAAQYGRAALSKMEEWEPA